MNELGFPGKLPFSIGGVPFDQISDFLRGMRGAMLDMYRCPDKLLAACEKLMGQALQRIVDSPRPKEYAQTFIALHRGADGFMSLKQFNKFYWPFLKKMVEALVAIGQTRHLFRRRLYPAAGLSPGVSSRQNIGPLRPLGHDSGCQEARR